MIRYWPFDNPFTVDYHTMCFFFSFPVNQFILLEKPVLNFQYTDGEIYKPSVNGKRPMEDLKVYVAGWDMEVS